MKDLPFINYDEIAEMLKEFRCPAHNQAPTCTIVSNDVNYECCCVPFHEIVGKYVLELVKVQVLISASKRSLELAGKIAVMNKSVIDSIESNNVL